MGCRAVGASTLLPRRTQNSYGVGFASMPFLPQPMLQWMGTSFRWWFDHMGDGTQVRTPT